MIPILFLNYQFIKLSYCGTATNLSDHLSSVHPSKHLPKSPAENKEISYQVYHASLKPWCVSIQFCYHVILKYDGCIIIQIILCYISLVLVLYKLVAYMPLKVCHDLNCLLTPTYLYIYLLLCNTSARSFNCLMIVSVVHFHWITG